MKNIPLPEKIEIKNTGTNQADIIIEPCYPGYGSTLGNALRRVLLSSLPGASITAIKIKGVSHEFSTLPGVKEDIVEIILNLKRIKFKLNGVNETTSHLKVKGQKNITAKDIKTTNELEIVDQNAPIATLTSKDATLEMELTINKGRGYVPVESLDKKKYPLGTIAIDAIYTPVKNVNYRIENVRVGQMTNYDKLIISILTDGSISPKEALEEAAGILVKQFGKISGKELKIDEEDNEQDEKESLKTSSKENKPEKETKKVETLKENKEKKKRGRPKKVA